MLGYSAGLSGGPHSRLLGCHASVGRCSPRCLVNSSLPIQASLCATKGQIASYGMLKTVVQGRLVPAGARDVLSRSVNAESEGPTDCPFFNIRLNKLKAFYEQHGRFPTKADRKADQS